MNIRTFQGGSMREAVQALRDEYGKEAIILNTKEKQTSSGKIVEITATSGEQGRVAGAEMLASGSELMGLTDRIGAIEKKLDRLSSNLVARSDIIGFEADLDEIKRISIEALQNNHEQNIYGRFAGHLDQFQKRLQIMGVDNIYLSEIANFLEKVSSKKKITGNIEEFLQQEIVRWLARKIRIAPLWEKTSIGGLAIEVIVGASGVGKSATAAKIAAQRHRDKLNVGLVSLEGSHLNSSDKLKVFSKVLGISYDEIDRIDQLKEVAKKRNKHDLLIVDTASRSPRMRERIKELFGSSHVSESVRYHLALSMTDRPNQVDRTIRSFSTIGIDSLIFTKLDESWSYGEILNLCIKWNLPLSYFGIGDRVPDDLERATKERVIERLIGI